jgi:hypothetical protein
MIKVLLEGRPLQKVPNRKSEVEFYTRIENEYK